MPRIRQLIGTGGAVVEFFFVLGRLGESFLMVSDSLIHSCFFKIEVYRN